MRAIKEPIDGDLESFWTHAINAARLYQIEAVGGQDDLTSLRPAAFAFGTTAEAADEYCGAVLSGKRRATTSLLAPFVMEELPIPSIGDMAILCDGSGRPRALIRTSAVDQLIFQQVGEDVSAAEGYESHDQWLAAMRELFAGDAAAMGVQFTDDANVVVEHFELLYPRGKAN